MIKFKWLLEKAKCYTGDPLETGGTSIQGDASPAIKKLGKTLKSGIIILDYGAGKYGRNSKYLRELGFEVYSYDPFNGKPGADGWKEVTTKKPTEKFDLCFTSYVLNVVPCHIEDQILKDTRKYGKKEFHITRNMDIFESVGKALQRKEKIVSNFFLEEFANKEQKKKFEAGSLTKDDVMEFCLFGTQTSRGFQRIPELENKGYKLTQKTSGFKVYEK